MRVFAEFHHDAFAPGTVVSGVGAREAMSELFEVRVELILGSIS